MSAPNIPGPTSAKQYEAYTFGLRHDGPHAPVFNDDYERRLPEDPYGHETQPNARVWRAYVEEATAFDGAMIGQARDGLDVLLVFAGLFSAVVTSFLVQVSNELQPDYSEITAVLLYDIVLLQLAAPGVTNLTVPSVNPTLGFVPNVIHVVVNGLWVVSLTASLMVALSVVLVKQWLHHYMTHPSGTPALRSHSRQFRLLGLERWKVMVIIGTLPIVMHASLALFSLGLVLFYLQLRTSVALTVAVIAGTVLIMYIASGLLPLFYPDCPYRTPLSDFLCFCRRFAAATTVRLAHKVQEIVQRLNPHDSGPLHSTPPVNDAESIQNRERRSIRLDYDRLSVDALDWLYDITSNPVLRSLVIQSIGGLPVGIHPYAQRRWGHNIGMQAAWDDIMATCITGTFAAPVCRAGQENLVERLHRSVTFLPSFSSRLPRVGHSTPEPHLELATWLSPGVESSPDFDHGALLELLSSYRSSTMHPTTWKGILDLVLRQFSPRFMADQSPALCAKLITELLPRTYICESAGPLITLDSIIMSPLLQSDVWDHIQRLPLILEFDDEFPIPRPSRTESAIAKFAASQITDIMRGGALGTRREKLVTIYDNLLHLTLTNILRGLPDTQRNLMARYKGFPLNDGPESGTRDRAFLGATREGQEFIVRLLKAMIDQTIVFHNDMSDGERGTVRTLQYPRVVIRIYSWASALQSFGFPSLYRLMYYASQFLTANILTDPNHPDRPIFQAAWDILLVALSRGHTPACVVLLQDEWLKTTLIMWIQEDHLMSPDLPHGIQKLAQAGLKDSFDIVERLHEPRNLLTAILTTSAPIKEFLRICPQHPSWQEVIPLLFTLVSPGILQDGTAGNAKQTQLEDLFGLDRDMCRHLRAKLATYDAKTWIETVLRELQALRV